MAKLLFVWYIINGSVVCTHKTAEGDKLYCVTQKEVTIEYAYKEEVLEWIKTDTFEYNEDLCTH